MRGFESDNAKTREWQGNKPNQDIEKRRSTSALPTSSAASRQGGSADPTPSTLRQGGSTDPLAKSRFLWNRAVKAEYQAKFEKWSALKSAAEKAGTSGNYIFFYLAP